MLKQLRNVFIKNEKVAHIIANCTSNNTIIQATMYNDKTITLSTGMIGFKGAKRSSSHAAQKVAEFMGSKLVENKVTHISLTLKGLGKGRKFITKGLKKKKINVLKIVDRTPLAHNGCRQKKKRRL